MLEEGVNDPAIFKAVFLAGGPGSGKSFIVGQTALTSLGLKLVNSDDAFEVALKKAGMAATPDNIFSDKGQALRHRSKKVTARRQDRYIEGRLGLVIDGTGKDVMKIGKTQERLQQMGYDTMMLFVNTSLEVAQQRNTKRDRSIPSDMVTNMWKQVQDNIMKFQQMFGAPNFFVVDNSGGLEDPARKENFDKVEKAIDKFLISPPNKRQAKSWIASNKKG